MLMRGLQWQAMKAPQGSFQSRFEYEYPSCAVDEPSAASRASGNSLSASELYAATGYRLGGGKEQRLMAAFHPLQTLAAPCAKPDIGTA
jgi:hypothetical protein